MSVLDQVKWSLRHSKRQLLESLLVVLAIALGVGVIITVLAMFMSIGQQYNQAQDDLHFRTLEVMGQTEFSRRQGAPLTLLGTDIESESWGATLAELEDFQRLLPANMHAYVEMYWSATTPLLPEEEDPDEEIPMWFYDANQIFVIGTTAEYFSFIEASLKSGNFFLPEDVRNHNHVLVLPDSLATEMFGDADPVGQVVPVSTFNQEETTNFTVIGVLEAPESDVGSSLGFGGRDMAYSPVTVSPYVQFGVEDESTFANVSVGLDRDVDIAAAAQQVEGEARLVWGDQIVVRSWLADYQETQKQLQRYAWLIGLFASVGLVIAVINILNLMLARVLKRTKSIGLSMALGSSRQLVFRQFVLEALSLGIIGSLLGIVLSFGLVALLEQSLGSFFMEGEWASRVGLGIAIGFLVSLFFGVYPAYLGSRTDPVDALRTD